MKVLVTGNRGYIGAHLVPLLKEAGHKVTGCDVGLFDGCEWETLIAPDIELNKDYRNISEEDLKDQDCIMHLAALSNDPMGDINPSITFAVNREGSIELAKKSKKAGVPRFLYSSSCSIYGKGIKMDLEEIDPTNPQTPYAISKIDTENALLKMADDTFSPVLLRNATAYGHSRNLRIDLVVNNLLSCAMAKGDIRIDSDGEPWRPLIHCKDIARAFIAFLEAPRKQIHNQIVNIGGNKENYQVKEVANFVQQLLPEANVVFTGKVGKDARDYRVKFDKLNKLLPNFKLEYDLHLGMQHLFEKFKAYKFNETDFNGPQFIRLKTLSKRLKLLTNDIY